MLLDSGGLPSGYKQCEYLETQGGQWIETDILAKRGLSLECKVLITQINDDFFCGVRKDSGNTRFYLLNFNSSYGFSATIGSWNTTYTAYYKPTPILNIPYVIKSIVTSTSTYIKVNDIERTKNINSGLAFTQTLPLFGGKTLNNTVANVYSKAGTRCYYARLYDNDVLVRNFIPALDKNGKPCMYDLVSKKPFYNQGADEFLYELKE